MSSSQAYGGLLVRIAANQEKGYPYFHEDPAQACADPGACHVRGWCWTGWRGRSPLPRRTRHVS